MKSSVRFSEMFQSTLPRRERLARMLDGMERRGVSIHAPAKGATQYLRSIAAVVKFQSTLPRRERLRLAATATAIAVSIHAPAKGATPPRRAGFHFDGFQSTLPRRERPYPVICLPSWSKFQSTLPRRERLGES